MDSFFFLISAVLLLLLPLNWLASVLAAAVIHELFHIAAIRILGGQMHSVHIGIGGAVITAELDNSFREMLCAAAGPIGSFSASFLFRECPQLALSAFLQGLFNLLPIYPLDGGRILRCLLEILGLKHIEWLQITLEILTISFILALSLYLSVERAAGIFPIVVASALTIKTFSRKRPCKREENRIQ